MDWYGLGQPFGAGASFQRPLRGVNPAAGASFALALPGDHRTRLIACVFTLTTDANVANRFVTVEYQADDGLPYAVSGAGVVIAASTTKRFAGAINRGSGEQAAGTDVLFPLAPVWSEPGWTLAIKVGTIQVGDTLTLIRLVLDQYPTGPETGVGG